MIDRLSLTAADRIALEKCGLLGGKPLMPASTAPAMIYPTIEGVAKATGLSVWTVSAIRVASRGQSDCPWSSRYTTAAKIKKWLFAHPEFVASRNRRKQPSHPLSFSLPVALVNPNPKDPDTRKNPNPIARQTRTRNPNPTFATDLPAGIITRAAS
jgi:hypothetical protein